MTLVGFDTALAVTSACVLRDDGRPFCTPPPPAARLFEPASHSQELLPELERLMSASGVGWDSVDSIAVGVGPGTFTGLRIGVATARGLAQAFGIGLRPVGSLEALAAGLGACAGSAQGARPLLAAVDARRRQVFAALYAIEDGTLERHWGPEVLAPAELVERVKALEPGPLCAGDWAIESRAELEEAGAAVPASDSGLHAVNALQLCRLAVRVEPVAPELVHPIYLRLPDAEINKLQATGERD